VRHLRRLGIAATFFLLGAATPTLARADEVATPCAADPLLCGEAPIAFSKLVELPVQGGFDTGWIPQNSPLQVHLFAQLYASSQVDLAGRLVTSWPEALTLAAPPEPGTGSLGIHYGLDVGAEASVTVTVLGQTYQWTGPIPYTPQIDFQVEAGTAFDPWAFQGVSVSGSTLPATLAQVSVTDFIGINIPGLDGGFQLDTSVDLEATYQTDAIAIRGPDGELVEGGALFTDDATTSAFYVGGPFVEFDVQPTGFVRYDGTIHLVPSFYIETLGPDYSIPVADVPIPFSFLQKDWTFDPVRVHVPLPDIFLQRDPSDGSTPEKETIELDFGEVVVGGSKTLYASVSNAGEALLAIAPETTDPSFQLAGDVELEQGEAAKIGVTFEPTAPGELTAELLLPSNDPDEPLRVVVLVASAVSPELDEPEPPTDRVDAVDDEGCDCRASAGQGSRASVGWLVALAAVVGASARRRSRRRG